MSRRIVEAAAAATNHDERVTRRLMMAIAADAPHMAADAEAAFRSGLPAPRVVIGHGRPTAATAVSRIWSWLDREFGPEITREAMRLFDESRRMS